ncbi:putative zinc finger, CCHC-type containing protein [Tanacetum coccineum]
MKMWSIADELALIQNPISEEDLVHIITQLGDEFNSLVAAIKVRESPITYSDLFDKLTDFERMLKEKDSTSLPIIPTVNVTQRQNSKGTQSQRSFQGYHSNHRKSRGGYNGNTNRSWQGQNGNRSYRADYFCNFCEIAGHTTGDCRKLEKFLRENNISFVINSPSPNAQQIATTAT